MARVYEHNRELGSTPPASSARHAWLNARVWLFRGLAGSSLAAAIALPWFMVDGSARNEFVHAAATRERSAEQWYPELVQLPAGVVLVDDAVPSRARPDLDRLQDQARPSPTIATPAPQAVAVGAMAVCRSEVTVGQWRAVMERPPPICEFGCDPRLPVHGITVGQAIEYLQRVTAADNEIRRREGQTELSPCYEREGDQWRWADPACTGFRLPTSAEWAYLAAADNRERYYFGEDPARLCDHANIADRRAASAPHPALTTREFAACDDGHAGLARVSELPVQVHPWALVGVYGNIAELAWNGSDFEARGGSILDPPLLATTRARSEITAQRIDLGFRCVQSSGIGAENKNQ